MPDQRPERRLRRQELRLGELRIFKNDPRDDAEPVLYYLSGRKLYVVGAQSGEYPLLGWRRAGFVVGKRVQEQRQRAAHLLNEMGGIWAQPIKVLDGFYFSIEDESGAVRELTQSDLFVNYLTHVEFTFRWDDLVAIRRDFVVEDDAALFSQLRIRNRGADERRLVLRLRVQVNLMPAWFTGWANGKDEITFDNDLNAFVAYDTAWPNRWAVAFGGSAPPVGRAVAESEGKQVAVMEYSLTLAAGETFSAPFLFVAENQLGPAEARQRFRRLRFEQRPLLEAKRLAQRRDVLAGAQFTCSDPTLQAGFELAKANLKLLEVELPSPLGRYFFAGIPEYVQLFGTDTCYSVPGIIGAGFRDAAGAALRLLRAFAERSCGRVPHEVTTNGRVFHPGGAQETPQFAIACWNYFRWTNDLAFLQEVYPLCTEGLLDYEVAHWDADLDFYPDGPSMIERKGADQENVDSVCYFCKALSCLAAMADALGDSDHARHYDDHYAQVLRAALNQDFWNDSEAMFASSLREDHSKRMDGYWTVVVPLETELADLDKAQLAMATLALGDGWIITEDGLEGLVHTRNVETTVWTLPTGILARAALAWGHAELGVRLLRSIALTALSERKRGALGMFEEVIPEGLSFLQLWSPAIYLQGIVEGLFGFNPLAHRDLLEIFPRPPRTWSHAEVRAVPVGDRLVAVAWTRDGGSDTFRICHEGGGRLAYILRLFAIPTGQSVETASAPVTAVWEKKASLDVLRLEFDLASGQEIELVLPSALFQKDNRPL